MRDRATQPYSSTSVPTRLPWLDPRLTVNPGEVWGAGMEKGADPGDRRTASSLPMNSAHSNPVRLCLSQKPEVRQPPSSGTGLRFGVRSRNAGGLGVLVLQSRVRLWGGRLSPQLSFNNPDKVGVKFPLILSCSDTYMFLQLLTDGSNRNSSYYQTIILSDRVPVAEEPKQKCRQRKINVKSGTNPKWLLLWGP